MFVFQGFERVDAAGRSAPAAWNPVPETDGTGWRVIGPDGRPVPGVRHRSRGVAIAIAADLTDGRARVASDGSVRWDGER